MWKKLIGLLLVAACSIPLMASESDYTYRDGYFWNSGTAYTRKQVASPTTYYYRNGCRYAYETQYYWEYTPVPTAKTLSYSTPDWKTQLLEVAKQRDAYEGTIRKIEADQKAYLDSINALGLSGNFRWPDYGVHAHSTGVYNRVGLYGNSGAVGSYGSQGSTAFGYSVKSVSEMYGSTDLNVLYQQAARLTQNAQTLAGTAHGEFHNLIGAAGDNAARVAEILARSEAASRVFKATEPPPSSKTTTTVTSSGTLPVPKSDDSAPTSAFLSSLGIPKCGSCHNDKDPKGGFSILSYPGMTPEQKKKVWKRILFGSPDKPQMPLGSDGKTGTSLSAEEIQKFLVN